MLNNNNQVAQIDRQQNFVIPRGSYLSRKIQLLSAFAMVNIVVIHSYTLLTVDGAAP